MDMHPLFMAGRSVKDLQRFKIRGWLMSCPSLTSLCSPTQFQPRFLDNYVGYDGNDGVVLALCCTVVIRPASSLVHVVAISNNLGLWCVDPLIRL